MLQRGKVYSFKLTVCEAQRLGFHFSSVLLSSPIHSAISHHNGGMCRGVEKLTLQRGRQGALNPDVPPTLMATQHFSMSQRFSPNLKLE